MTQEIEGTRAGISPEIDRAEFLLSMRNVPGTIAIIAAADGDDRTGMAATAWNSLCADPPMLLVCVNRNASAHSLIERTRKFSVNVVPSDAQETVAIFSAQRGLNGRDRFLDGHWSIGSTGQPLLNCAIAAFECDLVAGHAYGTHSVFVGRIRSIQRREDVEALMYVNGTFARAEGTPAFGI
ncbi:MAG: flavin reductase family protein [Novosphingobium sp.]|uniref:flavin reductase family protein n=1 Tax=Sphingobium yanoikuyae TaxID=13690 RepID=UPI000846AD76|nr:flavin reductase family protein [Sphingobium yanoikuyae]